MVLAADSKKEQQHQEHVNSAFAMDLAYEDDVVDLTGATESPPRPLAPVSAKREAGTASGAPAKKKPKAAPAATTKTGRRRERQKRNADVRSGLKPLPTPIVDFDAEAARGMPAPGPPGRG